MHSYHDILEASQMGLLYWVTSKKSHLQDNFNLDLREKQFESLAIFGPS